MHGENRIAARAFVLRERADGADLGDERERSVWVLSDSRSRRTKHAGQRDDRPAAHPPEHSGGILSLSGQPVQ